MSFATGGFGKTLPITGSALVIGGTAVPAPKLAAIAAAVMIVGFLLLRLARPQKIGDVVPGRPGRSRARGWRRGQI
ncbi:hypothetical protein [Actinoplanes sp. NBRC 101535]|uniref:hypothetical protein n=1 Tax=Actinoplanes sp. NBRC 101535 TaxID=3032196 RepID=UPI0024A5A8A7|nr:hypothetical protein [Actinoplanes sp. NBRC 101535]GLY08231.1 hypothetical protein Acsp01_86100 [Actinoplanes sp. NBRC 101535]